jgi:hypothetical protein
VQIVHRHQQRQRAGQADDEVEEQRIAVERDGAGEGGLLGGPQQRRGNRRGDQAEQADPAQAVAVWPLGEQVGEQHDEARAGDDQRREQRQPADVEVSHVTTATAAARRR